MMKLSDRFEITTSVKHLWVTDTDDLKIATSTFNGRTFVATFKRFGYIPDDAPRPIKSYIISYVERGYEEDHINGTGDAAAFVGTLTSIINDAIDTKHVEGMFIEAREENSRVKLFNRLLANIAKRHNWVLYDTGTDFKKFWWYGMQS